MDIKNLINSSTRIIVLKRALHVLALAQHKEEGVFWNARTITDVLSIEEHAELDNKIASDAINKAKTLFDSSLETKQGERSIKGGDIPKELESELVQFYSNFVVSDHIRKKSIDFLLEKHKGRTLWLFARLHFAIVMNQKCEISYSPLNSEEPRNYLIHPYHITINKNSFYLISLREKDGNVGLFPLQRIENLKVLDSTYSEEIPAIEDVFKNSFGSFINKKVYDFEIEYGSEIARVIDENFFHLNPVITISNERCNAKFKASDPEDICRELFYYGKSVEIIKPQKARDIMKRICNELIEVYT